MINKKIVVFVLIPSTKEKVWEALLTPSWIQKWNHASDDWETTTVSVDLRVGGRYKAHMQAKDLSFEFDFETTFTEIKPYESYTYVMDEVNREVKVELIEQNGGVLVKETFDPEEENPIEIQREGWQAILDNLKIELLKVKTGR
jgi:uncharacterized protein YndB with AHSA1/START domain